MASPTFFHELPEEQLKKLSQEDIQKIHRAEQLYWENKPYTTYAVALNGARTKKGGIIRASEYSFRVSGIPLALVGDEATYSDGSTSKIISGLGVALTVFGHSLALVGSYLENGDVIIETPETSFEFRLYHDDSIPKGFLDHKFKEITAIASQDTTLLPLNKINQK